MARKKLSLYTIERILLSVLLVMAIVLGSAVAYIVTTLSSLEEIEKLENYKNKIPTRVYDINNDPKQGNVRARHFAEFFYEKREIINFKDIPKNLINALVAIEDNNFYSHSGIDIWGMMRALAVDLFSGSFKQGGSTITQQLAKRMFTTSQKTVTRKIKELWYAVQIEKKYSKNEILELYFNDIYFGHGAYGVEAAAQIYFQKRAKDLNLGECAMLAALPSAPNYFSPIAFPNRARHRQRLVLLKMVQMGYISKDLADRTYINFWDDFSRKNLSPTLSAWHARRDEAPYFTEYVRQQLIKIYSRDRINQDGLKVYTSLDLNMQRIARAELHDKLHQLKTNYIYKNKKYMDEINNKHMDTLDLLTTIFDIPTIRIGAAKTSAFMDRVLKDSYKAPALMLGFLFGIQDLSGVMDMAYNYNKKLTREIYPEGAFVAIDPRNGHVKALIGGSRFTPDNRFNRAVQAYRQPGSSFKPFVYLAAIMSKKLSAGSAMDDSPVAYQQRSGQAWFPRNYDRHYMGRIVLRDALKYSVNIITIKILNLIGYDQVVSVAGDLLHIERDQREKRFMRAHSLALGGSECTPFELCNAFAIMANFGKDVQPISVLKVYDRDGKLLDDFVRKRDYDKESGKRIPVKQIIPKAPMFILITMLQDVVKTGTAAKAYKESKLRRKVGGKTGTASNWKDIWFAGITPQLAATVWMGFDDPARSLGRSASSSMVAAPVVLNFMQKAMLRLPHRWYRQPYGVYKGSICKRSGKAPTKACDKTDVYSEWFLQGTGPDGICEECSRGAGSAVTNFRGFQLGKKGNGNKKPGGKTGGSGLSITGGRIGKDIFDD